METQHTMWILGAVFALVGAPMVWLALRAFDKGRAIAAWPKVPGVITSAGLDSWKETSKDQQGFNQTHTRFRPIIQYRYTVAGQTLEGTRLHREDDTSLDQEAAQREIDPYPVGQQVMVLHDPQDPKTAFLTVKTSLGGIILCCFGGFWIALGLLMFGLSFL